MWAGPRVITHLGVCSLSLMAESSYDWVSVAVKRGIHPRKIVKMGWENKFAELLWIQVLQTLS